MIKSIIKKLNDKNVIFEIPLSVQGNNLSDGLTLNDVNFNTAIEKFMSNNKKVLQDKINDFDMLKIILTTGSNAHITIHEEQEILNGLKIGKIFLNIDWFMCL